MHCYADACRALVRRPPLALVFDMDGTIIDTRAFHMAAWRELVSELGLPPRCYEAAETGFGKTNWQIFEEWYGEFDERKFNRLSDVKEILFRDLIRGRAQARPGFNGLLAWARRNGVKIALATSGPRENAEFILGQLGVRRLFDAAVFGMAGMRGKPHPEPFLLAAKRLGLPPQRCLGFEDSRHGLWAVRRAQMGVVAIAETPRDLPLMRRWSPLVFQDFRPVTALLASLPR